MDPPPEPPRDMPPAEPPRDIEPPPELPPDERLNPPPRFMDPPDEREGAEGAERDREKLGPLEAVRPPPRE
jgi:hypothetical protein